MSNPLPDESKLSRARRLLAQAEGEGVTEAEARAFADKAMAYMAQHGIERAMLAEATDEIGSVIIKLDDPYASERGTLLHAIAVPMRCRVVLVMSRSGGRQRAKVVGARLTGFDSDRERVEVLFTSLLLQAVSGVAHQQTTYGNTRSFRSSWLKGYATRIGTRLRDIEASAQQDAEDAEADAEAGVALVLARRDDQVERWIEQNEKKGSARRTTVGNYSGYASGSVAGSRADLGQTRVGHKRTAIG